MSIYSIDVRVYATAYIRAESAEEAQRIASELADSYIEVDGGGDVEISGASYDDLPDVSLSPAMTVAGPDEGNQVELADE